MPTAMRGLSMSNQGGQTTRTDVELSHPTAEGGTKMPVRKCPYCKAMSNCDLGDLLPGGKADGRVSIDRCQNCGSPTYVVVPNNGDRDKVQDSYPKDIQTPPEELPEPVKKAYAEALVCYGAGAPNGALLMCRRAIQEALDGLGAKKGNLPTQLQDLVDKHRITPELKEWADHARIGGKLAGHGTGGSEWGDPAKVWGDKNDAEAVIGFCDAFFEYVYVLPDRNKRRRASTGTAPPVA